MPRTPPPVGDKDAFACQHCGAFVPFPSKTPVFSGAHPVHRSYTVLVHSRSAGPTCTTCAALDYLTLVSAVRCKMPERKTP